MQVKLDQKAILKNKNPSLSNYEVTIELSRFGRLAEIPKGNLSGWIMAISKRRDNFESESR